MSLYANLVLRHRIKGPVQPSEQSFGLQFRVPGMAMFRARRGQETVGIILCAIDGDKGYFHLGAYNEIGYRTMASYALVWSILQHFSQAGLRFLSIGAGAGTFGTSSDGLTAFKRGWANTSRWTYLCGAILNPGLYTKLTQANGLGDRQEYFPAYRAGEFE
jgi:hypothetical protein